MAKCVERRSDFEGWLTARLMLSDVCLDTGCTRTMIRQDLVPRSIDCYLLCTLSSIPWLESR